MIDKEGIREVKHHVCVKRQTRICTTCANFLFYLSLTFIISTPKLVLSIRIVLSSFYLLIFYFEKFSTWVWRLPFGLYVKLKFSTVRLKYFQKCYRIWTCIAVNQTTFFTAFRAFSLTRPAATQLYWNKRKFLHRKKPSTFTILFWDTNMAAVSRGLISANQRG